MFQQIPALEVLLLLHPELRAGAGANFGVLDSKVHVQENQWELIRAC
jgi:hypothetical protein